MARILRVSVDQVKQAIRTTIKSKDGETIVERVIMKLEEDDKENGMRFNDVLKEDV